MLYSMTGFGAETLHLRNATYSIEIKCLNSKTLDFNFKSSSLFRNLEIEVKSKIQEMLERGKIELLVYSKEVKKGFLSINEENFQQHYHFLQGIADRVGSNTDVFSLVVSNYASMTDNEDLTDEEKSLFFETINNCCEKVIVYRQQEGVSTTKDILDWLEHIRLNLNKVELLGPRRIDLRREKLLTSMTDIIQSSDIDYNRLGQEMIFYIEKFDISEEISRLNQHIDLFNKTIVAPENTGKKLGFVAQEMGREINTIGSKANDAEIQHHVVEMKDLLERIKEQLNNIL